MTEFYELCLPLSESDSCEETRETRAPSRGFSNSDNRGVKASSLQPLSTLSYSFRPRNYRLADQECEILGPVLLYGELTSQVNENKQMLKTRSPIDAIEIAAVVDTTTVTATLRKLSFSRDTCSRDWRNVPRYTSSWRLSNSLFLPSFFEIFNKSTLRQPPIPQRSVSSRFLLITFLIKCFRFFFIFPKFVV